MRSILIVEDEELELEFIEAVIHEELQLEDIVITANTGAQAVRQAKKRRPDIIIMDIMLPEMDGLEAIEEIRKFAPDTCISILTAYTDFRYAQRAISLRVFEYMLKPIKPSDFKATLKRTGGFGDRGIEGMIQAAQYARENNVPYFGICLGMQIMVMEFARGVLGYADANSSEFTPDGKHNVIALMADQQGNIPKGGTMRLGKYPCTVAPGTKMAECYGQTEIWERHRHRYEFNNDFRQEMQDAGLVISGTSPDGRLVETVELPGRAFHLGAQFHPEFKSRPNRAHPLFKGFIAAALKFRTSAQRSLMHL